MTEDEACAAWIAMVCETVGVPAEGIDVHETHALTRIVSDLERPMAPVAAFIWGLARAQHPDVDPRVLQERIAQVAR